MERVALTRESLAELSQYATIESLDHLNAELGELCVDLNHALAGSPITPCEPEVEGRAVETQMALVASIIGAATNVSWVKVSQNTMESRGLGHILPFGAELDTDSYQERILASVKIKDYSPGSFISMVASGVIKTPEYAHASSLVPLPPSVG
jgi:hypothetical protein